MSVKPALPPQPLTDLQQALDQESYEWLSANASVVLAALERELARGATPNQIKMFVIQRYGREDFAARIEQAARHIDRQAVTK